jgi:hypothetical protein
MIEVSVINFNVVPVHMLIVDVDNVSRTEKIENNLAIERKIFFYMFLW